jgi:hypothetical protein
VRYFGKTNETGAVEVNFDEHLMYEVIKFGSYIVAGAAGFI